MATSLSRGDLSGVTSGPEGHAWTHFEVRYRNQDPAQRRVLDGLLVGGRKLTEYRLGE